MDSILRRKEVKTSNRMWTATCRKVHLTKWCLRSRKISRPTSQCTPRSRLRISPSLSTLASNTKTQLTWTKTSSQKAMIRSPKVGTTSTVPPSSPTWTWNLSRRTAITPLRSHAYLSWAYRRRRETTTKANSLTSEVLAACPCSTPTESPVARLLLQNKWTFPPTRLMRTRNNSARNWGHLEANSSHPTNKNPDQLRKGHLLEVLRKMLLQTLSRTKTTLSSRFRLTETKMKMKKPFTKTKLWWKRANLPLRQLSCRLRSPGTERNAKC